MPKVIETPPATPSSAVDWDPVNWFAATWRDNQPLPKTPARSFDVEAAKHNYLPFVVDWNKAPCDLTLSVEEATFWFASCFGKGLGDVSMLKELTEVTRAGNGKIELPAMKSLLKKTRFEAGRAHGLVPIQILDTLLTGEDLVQLLCDSATMQTVHTHYRKRVLPFLSPLQKMQLQKKTEACLSSANWESDLNFAYYFAASLGMHTTTSALVKSWSDPYGARWDSKSRALQLIVFGLDSAESTVEQFKRLNLMLTDRDHTAAWVAHTIDTQLEFVWNCIRKASFAADTQGMLNVLACINSAITAEFMFSRIQEHQYADIATEYLKGHPSATVHALIAVSAREGGRSDQALAHLRKIRATEGDEMLRQVAAAMPPHLVRRLNEEILHPEGSDLPPFTAASTPDWLALAVAAEEKSTAKKKPPAWLDLNDMPPIVLSDHRLNPEQLAVLLNCLQVSTLEDPPVITTKLRAHAEPRSLDRFAWFLFETWLRNGGSSKENWAMFSLAFLGSDAIVPRLAHLIRQWPGESNHKRAVVGLECLRTIGSDAALMQINAIAEKVSFKGLKSKAEECMEAIAETRQLSRDRLADRIIPRIGFERSGERLFDFGDRHFIVTIGSDFKPVITDQAGKPRAELPTPAANDDSDLAQAAINEFKLLKKALRDLVSIQSTRLEQAMILSRRWFTDEFTSFLLNHPLMPQLLKRFVWGGFDMMGKLKSSFAIISRDEIVNGRGEPVDLSTFCEVGLLHPLQLPCDELTAWRADFKARKIEQTFAQLDRPLQQISTKEEHDVEILRLRNMRIPAVVIVGVLDKHGWQRGPVMEGGCYTEHLKYFPRADLTALVTYQGITTGMPAESDDQYIEYCAFLSGKVSAEYDREFQKGLPLGKVDPIVLSEVLSDLELIKAKGIPE
jgi:hypothetical protein